MESPPGPETVIDGVRYLYFGGTSYLGLAGHPEVIEAGCDALRRYGVHSATSRARFGTTPPVADVERLAAEFLGTEESFYFTSGYVSNHILVSALAGEADSVLVDEAAHYCVLEAARIAGRPVQTFRHRDAEDLAEQVRELRSSKPLVLADAVSPSSGAIAPVNEYLRVLKQCGQGSLVLDDAHGFGVLGERGRGVLEECGYWKQVNGGEPIDGVRLYVCGTLAKALGGFGGIIPGTREFIAQARGASHYFDGASAPASPVAGATAQALRIVMREPELRRKLRENVRHVKDGLRDSGLVVPEGDAANFGVAVGDADNMTRIHETLKERGILLPYVNRYAGIPASGLLRFAIFANHSRDQLDRLLNELKSLL